CKKLVKETTMYLLGQKTKTPNLFTVPIDSTAIIEEPEQAAVSFVPHVPETPLEYDEFAKTLKNILAKSYDDAYEWIKSYATQHVGSILEFIASGTGVPEEELYEQIVADGDIILGQYLDSFVD